MNNFLFLGGDYRLIYAAENLNKRFDCFLYGHDNIIMPEEIRTPMLRDITKCKNLVLGLPASRDGVNVFAPNSTEKIPFEIIPEVVERGGSVFTGKTFPKLLEVCEKNGNTVVDYFDREELVVMNAVPTAEGTIEILIRENKRTLYNMPILITGFGRITKVLAKYLVAMGAKVTVCARKHEQLYWARIMGCESLHISKLQAKVSGFGTIINTVPYGIFTNAVVKNMQKNALFVDLASDEGLENVKFAEERGIRVIWALSLPLEVMR